MNYQTFSHPQVFLIFSKVIISININYYFHLHCLNQGWPTRGPRAACGPNSNRESAIFEYLGCISSIFCCIAAQKVYIFGKIFKLRPRHQFGLATPGLNSIFCNATRIKNMSEFLFGKLFRSFNIL